MPTRAPTPCSFPLCPNPATLLARCALHPRPGAWSSGAPGRAMPPDWPSTRARILARDQHRCRMCGGLAAEVHHLERGAEADHMLVSLCGNCHKIVERRRTGDSAPLVPLPAPPRVGSDPRDPPGPRATRPRRIIADGFRPVSRAAS